MPHPLGRQNRNGLCAAGGDVRLMRFIAAMLTLATAATSAAIGAVATWRDQPRAHSSASASIHSSSPGIPQDNAVRHRAATRSVELIAEAETTLSPTEQELLEWAIQRFAAIGWTLPEVEISFSDETRRCNYHQGIMRRHHGRRHVVICVPDHGTAASKLWRQRTLIHELAHAWDFANLDDNDRSHLLGVLGTEHWLSRDQPWEERGAERFAETITWGLYDQLRRPVLIDVSCHELHVDFKSITGTAALGPIERVCRLDPDGEVDDPSPTPNRVSVDPPCWGLAAHSSTTPRQAPTIQSTQGSRPSPQRPGKQPIVGTRRTGW